MGNPCVSKNDTLFVSYSRMQISQISGKMKAGSRRAETIPKNGNPYPRLGFGMRPSQKMIDFPLFSHKFGKHIDYLTKGAHYGDRWAPP